MAISLMHSIKLRNGTPRTGAVDGAMNTDTRIKQIRNLEIALQKTQMELYETEKLLCRAESILEEFDFRRCDIAACNCNGYHKRTPEPEV